MGLVFVYAFLKKLYWRIGLGHDAQNGRNFRKRDVSEAEVEFWRPCRLSPGKGFAPSWQGKNPEDKFFVFFGRVAAGPGGAGGFFSRFNG